MNIDINLNNLICDTFVDVIKDIITCNVDRAILKGGRSSTKSQVIATSMIVGVMCYRTSGLAAVKYANKIEERLVNTFKESIRYLGVERFWKLRKSPFEYVLLDDYGKETDVSIKFTGCDNPENLKSFKPRKGSFRYIWYEETTNFPSLKEVNSLTQTFARGEGKHVTIMTYNPPMSTSNWVNKEFNIPVGQILGYGKNSVYSEFVFEVNGEKQLIKQVIHHSTYMDVINSGHSDWLGTSFIGEAEKSKIENNQYYRWAYLGEVVGTDANVFRNITDWKYDLSNINATEVFRGYDWGYGGPDPCAYCEWIYDRRTKSIYCINDFGRPKMDIDEVVENMRKFNKNNFPIMCDSANPLLNRQLSNKGINIENVKKGKDSVKAGIKWLQNLNHIYIDKNRTPNVYREFKGYEFIVDKEDQVTSALPDKDNHWIDATRYALSLEIKYNT